MANVFISYVRDDQPAAVLIASRLRSAGFSVFFDLDSIVAGDRWSDRIESELRESSAIVVILSSHARSSRWVKDEVQMALDSAKLVIPVLIDEGATENWLWPLLARRQRIELDINSLSGRDEQLDHLVAALATARSAEATPLAGIGGSPAIAAIARSAAWRIAAVALLSAAIGGVITWLLK